MTPYPLAPVRKPANSHAAFALHTSAAMASRFAVLVCVLGLPLAARAQSTAASGMCSGMMTGTIGLAVPKNGGLFTIPTPQITTGVFGSAECECAEAANNPDISIEIKLTTALPASTAATAQIWVGDSSCTNSQTRTSSSNTTCENIASPPIQDFTVNSTANSGSGLHYVIKADALSQPFKHMCDPTQPGGPPSTAANSIYVFIFQDPSMPLATCMLTLSEQLKGPDPVTNTSASGGDGAVTLNWTPPPLGTFAPSFFQVLCTDDCGNPVKSSPNTQIYSTCNNGVLARRDLTTGGSGIGTGTDGGVASAGDMSLAAATVDGRRWEPRDTTCPADMGVDTTADGGVFGPGSMSNFNNLDPSYVCTDQINPSQNSARISGLVNGQVYHFFVLSVDAFGNATASPRIDASPQPTEDLWRRYRDAGGGGGGCFIATAAFGSYENRWVWVLRDFRDQVLLLHDSGRWFVDWYYAHSPPAAAWIAAHGWARAITRVLLAPLIAFAWFWLYFAPWQKLLVVIVLVAFALRKRIRRRFARSAA